VQITRSIVRGQETTPKNHQQRRVDLSPQLHGVLRRWRAEQGAAWLRRGSARPAWISPSSAGTSLDESNARKAFNRILDKAELHRRGPHQMRHTFASLLLQAGVPITYVSRQLGHRDSAITLRVYAHWLPEVGADKGVDRLDDGATIRNLSVTRVLTAGARNYRKRLKERGEPPRNRTGNLQIKSLKRDRK
jgi:integrase